MHMNKIYKVLNEAENQPYSEHDITVFEKIIHSDFFDNNKHSMLSGKDPIYLYQGSDYLKSMNYNSYKKREKPADTPLIYHKITNQLAQKKLGVDLRNLQFATTFYITASRYGQTFAIFPIGQYVLYYSDKHSDFYHSVASRGKVNTVLFNDSSYFDDNIESEFRYYLENKLGSKIKEYIDYRNEVDDFETSTNVFIEHIMTLFEDEVGLFNLYGVKEVIHKEFKMLHDFVNDVLFYNTDNNVRKNDFMNDEFYALEQEISKEFNIDANDKKGNEIIDEILELFKKLVIHLIKKRVLENFTDYIDSVKSTLYYENAIGGNAIGKEHFEIMYQCDYFFSLSPTDIQRLIEYYKEHYMN